MANTVISVENLSKSYRLGQIGTGTLTNDLNVWWAKMRGKPNPMLKIGQADYGNRDGETLWALRDVSFKVEQGEVLGIIGRNGAGKSTLLKILSRVTAPTSGCVKVKGRIASLLEVGTGFHPELTGRENVYLNGAILGMTKQEVTRKFDEIVAFAEVEKFIDTPVKRYSSGMYVRLAFAVAAHLESEILLVDEVLAVGDAEFQKKCLGKMGDVATNEGRTVLFVSHNMAAIQNLCPNTLLLTKGMLSKISETESVVSDYYLGQRKLAQSDLNDFRPTWAKSYIKDVKLIDKNGLQIQSALMGEDLIFQVEFSCPEDLPIHKPILGVVINHNTRGSVAGVNMRMTEVDYQNNEFQKGKIYCHLSNVNFIQGEYTADFWLGDGPSDIDAIIGYLRFSIVESDIYGTGKIPYSHFGVVYVKPSWKVI